MSGFEVCNVILFRQQLIVDDRQALLHFLGCVSSGLIRTLDHVDGGSQALPRLRSTHQRDDGVEAIKQHPAAGSAKVREQTTLDGIVLGAVRRIVSDGAPYELASQWTCSVAQGRI